MDDKTTTSLSRIQLRTFRPPDAEAVTFLQRHGEVLAGLLPALPLTAERVEARYFAQPPNHLWVAEREDLLVGAAGLVHEQPMVARLAMLVADPAEGRDAVAEVLLQAVSRHCHHFGYLKLVVPTVWPADEVSVLFSRPGLRYTRHRGHPDGVTSLLEFYVDLYRSGHGGAAKAAGVPADEMAAVR